MELNDRELHVVAEALKVLQEEFNGVLPDAPSDVDPTHEGPTSVAMSEVDGLLSKIQAALRTA